MRHHALGMPAVVVGLCLITIALLALAVPVSHAAPLPALTQTAEPPTSTPTTLPSSTATALPTGTATAAPSAIATSAPTSTATALSTSTPTAEHTEPTEPAEPGVADPAVMKQADVRTAAIGDLVTFTLTVTNNGNRTARGVVVEDSLPGFLGFVSASADRGQVVQSGATIGFWIGDVAPGELLRCMIVARVLAVAVPPDNRNSVQLSTTSGSDNPTNNADMVELNISPASEATAAPAPSAVLPTVEPTAAPAPNQAPPVVLSDPPSPVQLPTTSTSAEAPTLTLLALGSLLVAGGVAMRQRARRSDR